LPACSRMAATTRGWAWPVLVTAMPQVKYGDAAGEIQIASAVARVQVAPFAVGHDEIGVARPDRRHVFEAGGGHEPPWP